MNKQDLGKILEQELAAVGYRKRATTWYKHLTEGIILIDLQKSNYGDQYYLNIACVPMALGQLDVLWPKEHKCPIRIRATSALPEVRQEIEKLFNIGDTSIDDASRREDISRLLQKSILPFLKCFESLDDLRLAYKSGLLNGGLINKAAQAILNHPPANPS